LFTPHVRPWKKWEDTRRRRIDTAVEWIAEGKSRNWKYERAKR
jgi:hypothetical protein